MVVDQLGGEPDFSLDEQWLTYSRLTTPTQVYVFDRAGGVSTLVSKAPNGSPGNGDSRRPSISGDGRWVAFESAATNLAGSPTSGGSRVWMHDRQIGTNTLVSIGSNGSPGTSSYAPSISTDGALVAFHGDDQLLPQTVNGLNGVRFAYVRDVLAGVTHWMPGTSAPQARAGAPAISGDGRIAYFSEGVGSEAGSVWGAPLSAGATGGVISPSHSGFALGSPLRDVDTTLNGGLVAFVQGQGLGSNEVWVYDMGADLLERVNVSNSGAQAVGNFGAVRLSNDGTHVAFTGSSTVLNQWGATSVFIRDRTAGTTFVASIDPVGNPVAARSSDLALSSSGRWVAFGDGGSGRLLVRDTLACPGFASYCTPSTTTNGCTPTMSAVGTPSAAAASPFTLQVGGVEGQRTGLLFYGRYPTAQSWALGSSSYLCVLYPVQRLGAVSSGGSAGQCNGVLSVDWNNWSASTPTALGHPFLAGDTFYAQGWFRDPGMPKGTNLSNGLRFTFCD
jgi:Tol biopolymer transport system component